eukprot:1888221-Prymnesium_polylepis.1
MPGMPKVPNMPSPGENMKRGPRLFASVKNSAPRDHPGHSLAAFRPGHRPRCPSSWREGGCR